ncbi:MAG: hypothetical protein HYR88_14000 [Verrucomicrobia bacterium]|nr:hypothetical protein [Verrucomicrobiota bacterium]MBI3871395.1 hypothetical protein [Verrucomicrobiota bacterium]
MKKTLGGLTLCLLAASSYGQSFYAGNGHYYEVVRQSGISWDDARAAALSKYYSGFEGHLVTISDAAEDAFVHGVVVGAGLGEVYAGGFQNPAGETDPQAGWTWVNGEGSFPGFNSVSPYANWNPGEPNDYYGSASEQWLGLNFGSGWNDEGNLGNIDGYVVEYDPKTIRDTPDSGSSIGMFGGAMTLLGMISRRLRK